MISLYCYLLDDENIIFDFLDLMEAYKFFSRMKGETDFKDIDQNLLNGFECSQFSCENKKFLSMIKEQTISAIHNKKYWSV